MKVHYIAQYIGASEANLGYTHSPGGVSKMNYFLYCLSQMKCAVQVYSLCYSKKSTLLKPRTTINQFGQTIKHCFSIAPKNKILNQINILFLQIQLFLYLLKVSNKDTVFFYHERFYAPVIKIIKKIKRFRIICDVEEIYTIHAQHNQSTINKEVSYLTSFAYYTLATSELANILNIDDKKHLVCNGVYAPILNHSKQPSSTIRVLYAGTFDKTKGGVYAAIEAFKYLDKKYNLVICGFGNESDTNAVKRLIKEHNVHVGFEQIKYLGFIPSTSQEYQDVLATTDIGLSTQNASGAFNTSSFPSKIFEYMRFGLKVVSTPISVAQSIPISEFISFAQSSNPSDISKAIYQAERINLCDQNFTLEQMHQNFINGFSNLLFDHE